MTILSVVNIIWQVTIKNWPEDNGTDDTEYGDQYTRIEEKLKPLCINYFHLKDANGTENNIQTVQV